MLYRIAASSLFVLVSLVGGTAHAQDRPQPTKVSDELAIRKATGIYVSSFNERDVDGMLSVFAANGEYVDEAGKSTKGKTALAAMFKKVFDDHKSIKIAIKTTAVRILKEDVAMQDGNSTYTTANGEKSMDSFTTVWIKKDGKWLIHVVHDIAAPMEATEKAAPAGVKDLAWLIGDWVHEEKDTKTTVTGKWMKGQKFIALDYSVRTKGEETLSLTQVIGWDPTGGKAHSWVFDSRGGFGEGSWTREGNTWTVQTSGVTHDGRLGSGKMIWTFVDDDNFIHEGVDRVIDGQPLPDRKTKYQRVK